MTPEEDLLARAERANTAMWLTLAAAAMRPPRGYVREANKRSVRRKSKKELRKRKSVKASRRKNR